MSTDFIPGPPFKPLPTLAIADDPAPLRFRDREAIKTGPCITKGESGYETAGIQIQLAYDRETCTFFTVWCKTPFTLDAEKPRLVTAADGCGKIIWTNS